MNRTTTFFSFVSAILVAAWVANGCKDDDNDNNPAATPTGDGSTPQGDGSTTGDGATSGNPPPPALGAQIDRFGRPAVNTALNASFEADAGTAGAAKDAYNANANAGGWVAAFKPEIAKNLAILDSLDTVCGNQILADTDAGADRYGTLATVLADDRQWLNTASTTCTTYLAVELNATGKIPNTDCGGRRPPYDVIDVTYSALAIGAPAGVTDGIAAVPAKVDGATFPYLAAPQ